MSLALSLTDFASSLGVRSYSITELCEEFGVTARALRFYEDEGLIAPKRNGLARIYSSHDRARLAWVLRTKRLGFNLSDIREMLDLFETHEALASDAVRGKCLARIDLLKKEKVDIDTTLYDLNLFLAEIGAIDVSATVEDQTTSFQDVQESPSAGEHEQTSPGDQDDTPELKVLAGELSVAAARMEGHLDRAIKAVRASLDPKRDAAARKRYEAEFAGSGELLLAGLR